MAQAWGRGDHAEQEAVFWRALLTALVLGIGVVVLAPLLLKAGLAIMAPTPGTAEETSRWFSIRVLSGPAALANYAILGFLLGRGQARLGLVLRGFSQRNPMKMEGLLDRARLRSLFSLNTDIMIRSFVLLAALVVMTRIGASFGPVALAVNAVLMNFFMVAGFWLDGLANAAETIVGRAVGARYLPAFLRGVWLSSLWSFALAALTASLLYAVGHPLIDFLTTVPEVRGEAYAHLPWAALTALTGCLAFLMDGIFIGATWSHAMRNRMVLAFLGFCLALGVLVPSFGNHGRPQYA